MVKYLQDQISYKKSHTRGGLKVSHRLQIVHSSCSNSDLLEWRSEKSNLEEGSGTSEEKLDFKPGETIISFTNQSPDLGKQLSSGNMLIRTRLN